MLLVKRASFSSTSPTTNKMITTMMTRPSGIRRSKTRSPRVKRYTPFAYFDLTTFPSRMATELHGPEQNVLIEQGFPNAPDNVRVLN